MWSRVVDIGITGVYAEVAENIPCGLRGSDLVLAGYEWYKSNYDTSAQSQRATNGRVFECLILDALCGYGIYPVYYQAKVVNVPNVTFDILLFHPNQSITLSCKVSLRERWKQADLEGLALKQVYRGARNILLTLSDREGHSVSRGIQNSNVMGLDQCVVIEDGASEFDDLLDKLKGMDFIEAYKVLPVTGTIIQ